jgi:hypothetical protein
MTWVVDTTHEALVADGWTAPAHYLRGLQQACRKHPPPFGAAFYGEQYRAAAADPGWLARSLAGNAGAESLGARKLWELAGRTSDPTIRDLICRHAMDECRHARLYIAMCETLFPDSIDKIVRTQVLAQLPRYTATSQPADLPPYSERQLIDAVVQINLGEIRTRLHQLLLAPVATAYCLPDRQPKLVPLLRSLLADETRHVAYTAQLIAEAMNRGFREFVELTMARRLEQINRLTVAQLGGVEFVDP